MRETPPAPQDIARWLLAPVGGEHKTVEELTIAAVHTYEQLRTHLALFLGPIGFDALWSRTLHVVRRTFPWEHSVRDAALPPPHHQLGAAVQERTIAEANAVLQAIFTQFFDLLFTFIGAELGIRLLQQCWPALSGPTTSVPDKEAQL